MSGQRCKCATNSDEPGYEHQDGCPVVGLRFFVHQNIKMLREALCLAQSALNRSTTDVARCRRSANDIQKLIDECDRHRPLGSNGKHGNLHTATCGCEDK